MEIAKGDRKPIMGNFSQKNAKDKYMAKS